MKIKFLFPCYLWIACLCAISCGKSQEASSPRSEKKRILVSIAPYQSIVEKVAGSAFAVQTVVPEGSNPHVYEPTTKQISSIREGSVWFRIGEPFEDKLISVLKEKNPDLTVTDLRDNIDLIHDHTEGSSCCCQEMGDRHIWLSPKLSIVQVENITEVLSQKFPESKDFFTENARNLIQELEKLDQELEEILTNAKTKKFAVSHSAFAYFCKDYHLEQISIEFGGKDPTLLYLSKVKEDIQTFHVKLGIAMPQHSNKGLEIIGKTYGMQIERIDPYSPDFFNTLRHLAHLIAET